MAVTKRLRFEILRRDGFVCRYCGAQAPDVELTVDHVTPKALGGRDEPENLVAACRPCNTGKSSSGPDEHHVAQVADDALRWAAAMKRAQMEMLNEDTYVQAVADQADKVWGSWWYGPDKLPIPRPSSWRQTIRQLLGAGLDSNGIETALLIALEAGHIDTDQTWRYFCGVAWRKVDELQQRAALLLEEGR
jgi:HNH endonuclease